MPTSILKTHNSRNSTYNLCFSRLLHVFNINSKGDYTITNHSGNGSNIVFDKSDTTQIGTKISISNNQKLNLAGKIKHYPPANKEWFNSVYAYSKNTVKVLPSTDKTLARLIKSYFSLYSRKLEKKVKKLRSRRSHVRKAKLSTKRILVSRAELKHTSNKVVITVYIYNNEKNYYFNKLRKIPTVDKLGKLFFKGWTLEEQSDFINSEVNKNIYQGWSPGILSRLGLYKANNVISENLTYDQLYMYFLNKFRQGLFISKFPKPLSLIVRNMRKNKDKNKGKDKKEQKIQTKIDAERWNRKAFIDNIGPRGNSSIMEKLSRRVSLLKSKMQFQEKGLYLYLENKGITFKKNDFAAICKAHEENYVQAFVSKFLRKEIVSVYFKQLIRFNKLKFEDKYVLFLKNELRKVYNKEIEFNFVNLKYLYLSNSIFSSTLVTKIRNRKNRFLKVLKDSLLMFNSPPVNRRAIYDEIYNKKMVVQNHGLQSVLNESRMQNITIKSSLDVNSIKNENNLNITGYDVLDKSLLKLMPKADLELVDKRGALYTDYHKDKLSNVITGLKHKSVNGIRIEIAGRLTKRNTAARSLFKLRYKGNIRNMDSSDKGLSTVMLRGHAKSNVDFGIYKSKIRIGSYGFKGWISTS